MKGENMNQRVRKRILFIYPENTSVGKRLIATGRLLVKHPYYESFQVDINTALPKGRVYQKIFYHYQTTISKSELKRAARDIFRIDKQYCSD